MWRHRRSRRLTAVSTRMTDLTLLLLSRAFRKELLRREIAEFTRWNDNQMVWDSAPNLREAFLSGASAAAYHLGKMLEESVDIKGALTPIPYYDRDVLAYIDVVKPSAMHSLLK